LVVENTAQFFGGDELRQGAGPGRNTEESGVTARPPGAVNLEAAEQRISLNRLVSQRLAS
jgi:predicted HicB family RNase H-like nuclease